MGYKGGMPKMVLKEMDAINETKMKTKMIRDNLNKLREGWVLDLQPKTPKTKTRTKKLFIAKTN